MSLPQKDKINVLVVEDSQGVRAFVLTRILYKVGRAEQSDIQIIGKEVSRNHATLLRVPLEHGGFAYCLVDGDSRTKKPSSNGTYVNGNRITTHQLKNNDLIVFSQGVAAKLLYLVPDAAERVLASPAPIFPEIDPAFRMDIHASAGYYSHSAPTVNSSPVQATALPLNPKSSLPRPTKPVINSPSTSTGRSGKRMQHSRLGQFFLRTSALDEQELDAILREQSTTQKRLGELLVEKGMISQEELDRALENQQILLGEVLVKHNYITQQQLEIALQRQSQTFEPLGEILVREGWVTVQEMEQALKEQHWRRNGFWFLD
jgi:hypothetical protein